MAIADIRYTNDELFTTFISGSSAGDSLMSQLMEQMDGTNKVFNFEAKRVIAQIRNAGYSVKKITKKESAAVDTKMLREELAELA